MKRYFVTGTDTNCGKTYVTSKLINYFPLSVGIKPIASGCIEKENELINPDAELLKKASNLSLNLINPWRFKLPVSPHIAAKKEGKRLSITEIAEYCINLQLKGVEKLFIEGAGGLMVPLNEEETWVDFLEVSKLPVILVVGMKLGCINHALLSAALLQAKKIKCEGWIANCIDPHMQALEENMDTLSQKLDFPLLAKVPFASDVLMML